MKYILFLFCIIFFNHSLWAQNSADLTGGIKVNLGNYKSDFNKPSTDFRKAMDDMDRFSTGSDPYALSTPPDFSFGNTSGTINFRQAYCSVQNPEACLLYTSCRTAGGYWDILESKCTRSTCHLGTRPDPVNATKCLCNNDAFAYVDRGNFLQSCPSRCLATENASYAFLSRSCVCNDGYTMATNGTCVANPPPAQPVAPNISECLRELAEKATACEAEATTAVNRCDSGEDDSLNALSGLLASTSGSASENCDRAATASNSAYLNVEDTRRLCDAKINSCRTSCTDATTFLNANKDRVYNACRDRAYQAEINAGPALPPDRFNTMWDSQNKANLDSQFQGLITRIDGSRATCETGTAAKNREKLSTAMNEMNTTSKSASQCVCQLGSSSADCAKAVGPADCSQDASLPGCAKVVVNCFDPKNVSLKCVCFRNPESFECKGTLPSNLKANEMDASSLVNKVGVDTRGNNAEVSGMAGGKTTTEGTNNFGAGSAIENIKVENEPIAITAGASESAVSSAETPSAAPAAAAPAAGTDVGGGNGSNNAGVTAKDVVVKKLGGFFETAKSALGGLFKKGSRGGETSGDGYRDGGGANHPTVDHKKFRPRGMVRGIASDEELAGKHEDIWKVMNKQYKVQDQKDNFIFEN